MKNIKYLTLALALLLVAAGASAKSYKRGVSENSFTFGQQLELLSPGVTWYYNWANAAPAGYQNEVVNSTALEYIPMCWNGGFDADKIRTYCAEHPGVKYLLGFNEPNFTAQANMTPSAAAEKWPEVQALAKELGLMLVAPAMNYSPNEPYQDPTKWMDEFVQLVGSDAFDFTAIHNYGGLGVMKTLGTQFHEKYGKPVWVTEFCYWPDEGNTSSKVEPATQIASMVESVQWLEQTEWIYRYAWFKPVGQVENTSTSSSPCYGLIIPVNGYVDRELSQQGYNYVYLPDFDRSVFQPVNTVIGANQFVNQKNTMLDKTYDPSNPTPVDISSFTGGAYADYQFDIPTSETYTLTLCVAGVGEPTRYDPTIAIYSVDADGNETLLHSATQFEISGSDEVYTKQSFEFPLPAGQVTIRIKDGNAYKPSGIRISTLSLNNAATLPALRADDDEPVDVYRPDGTAVRRAVSKSEAAEGLTPGLYIIGTKKILISD